MPQPLTLPTLDLATLHARLHQLISGNTSRDARIVEALQLLIGLTNAAAVLYAPYQAGQRVPGQQILSKQALTWHPDLVQLLLAQIDQACLQQTVQISQLDQQPIYLISCPVYPPDSATAEDGIGLVLVLGDQAIEMFVTVLQLVAGYLGQAAVSTPPPPAAPDGLDIPLLISHLLAAGDFHQASRNLLDSLHQGFAAQRVVLGLPKGRHCRVQAISDLPDIKRQADFVHVCEALMDSTLLAAKTLNGSDPAVRKAYPDVQRLLLLAGSASLLSLPLPLLPSGQGGVLLLLWQEAPPATAPEKLQRLALPLGMVLTSLYRHQRGWPRRAWQQLRSSRAKQLAAVLLPILLIGLLWLPVTHRISGTASLDPTIRRFLNAPFDGVLKQSLREPGDLVKTGDTLAHLDEREIEWELSGLEAERARARKQKDVSAAARDTAAAQLAQLEIERQDAQIALLQYRLSNLEVKSPIDGMLISGDLKRAQGSPLNKGQTLFEIAPLDSMLVQLAVPADDIPWLSPGMPLEIRLDAYPGEIWRKTLENIQPRAVVRDGQHVFILETRLDNPDRRLRPGMQGSGKVAAGQASLGWVLFHKIGAQLYRWIWH